jgi:hypothetical protein
VFSLKFIFSKDLLVLLSLEEINPENDPCKVLDNLVLG